MSDEDPEIYDIVNTWLYSKGLTVNKEGLDQECDVHELVELFVFGDKYDMSKLRNNVIDRVIRRFECGTMVAGGFRYIYDKTPP